MDMREVSKQKIFQMLYCDIGDDRNIKDSKNKIKNFLGKVLNHPVK